MKQNRVISGAVAALVLAALLAGCGSTATGASSHILGQNVLAVKQHLQRSLDFLYCPLSLMERTQKRKQHIGDVYKRQI